MNPAVQSFNDIRVAVRDATTGRAIKLCKIVPYASGGFAILLPYHDAASGLLFKYETDYGTRWPKIDRRKSVEYRCADKVKLSYHPDGFVQFSGAHPRTVRSGIDHSTGIPKGLGVFSFPLAEPVTSGPSIALGFWGLHGFERANSKENLVFHTDSAKHLHPRKPLRFSRKKPNSFVFEVFLVRAKLIDNSVIIDSEGCANLALMHGTPEDDPVLVRYERVRLLRLGDQPFVFCFLLNTLYLDWSDSGYYIMGPTDGKHGLMGIYPPPPTVSYGALPSIGYAGR